jgi:anthranilate synthase component 1
LYEQASFFVQVIGMITQPLDIDPAIAAPTVLSLYSDLGTPLSIFHRIAEGETTAFLFESAEGDSRLARFSFIGVDPVKTISFKKGMVTVRDNVRHHIETSGLSAALNPLQFLKHTLETCGMQPIPSLPYPFTGGLVGYMGYGATRYFDGIAQQDSVPYEIPEGHYGLYDSAIVFDHQFRRIVVISHRGEEHARGLVERIIAPSKLPALFDHGEEFDDSTIYDGVTGPFTKESFVKLVEQSKEYIYEGQVFQIVVSQRFSMPISSKALDIYRVLQAINPSPYAYFLKCPDFAYLGSSPETFVKCENGKVTLRALAGTRPRGTTEADDKRLALELCSDEKELAEHRMLVDLGRNDLGRICKVGTVKVGEIATLTRYTHVMHLATDVTGELRDDKTCFDVFQSCFPRGTVSGAPKIRAMKLLSQLEPEQRGVYSGVVGYFDLSGNMDGAIAIRSALIKDGLAHVNAGAGIVYDSNPIAEYEETRNKAKSVVKAIKLAEKAICR